jgi:hypothetical protein
MELVISLLIGAALMEAYAWLPQFSDFLCERAVRGVHLSDRDRCREEWKAALNALPNTIIKPIHAVSYFGAAREVNADFFETSLASIDALIRELDNKLSVADASLAEAKQDLARTEMNRERLLGQQLFALNGIMKGRSNEENKSVARAVSALDTFANTISTAAGRSAELLMVHADKMNERLDAVKRLIVQTSDKRDRLVRYFGRAEILPDTLDALVDELMGELNGVNNIFSDDKWGDDEALREANRITAILNSRIGSLTARP